MREMDILFEKFLDQEYDSLTDGQKHLFEAFLDESDADIYSWLTGHSIPDKSDYLVLIEKLRVIQS